MQKPKNWDLVQVPTNLPKLPAGGYVCKILEAKEVESASQYAPTSRRLDVSFDISEGDYKDHYVTNYREQTQEDKSWKGVLRLNIPEDELPDDKKWVETAFKRFEIGLEESNPGYHWDWNEEGLKGKLIGITFQNKEWEFRGRKGWTAQAYGADSIESIRKGIFYMPADKPLNSNPTASASNSFTAVEDSEDLPF